MISQTKVKKYRFDNTKKLHINIGELAAEL